MSGLFALLDDVAAIAKVAAASVDDVAGAAAKAGSKAVGIVVDDAAVTPKYVTGFDASRELPMIWRITRGSLFNKLVILLPIAMLLANFLPGAITPLLMLGGCYLCFEGAEKVWHVVTGHGGDHAKAKAASDDPAHLEEANVAGAIRTDFILSAEIMTISLAALPEGNFWIQAAALALVGVGITFLVYGSVALIVKADDVGLHLHQEGRFAVSRAFGHWLVRSMPMVMHVLSTVGTVAMLWVGGSIILHGLHTYHLDTIYTLIHDAAYAAAHAVPSFEGAVKWAVTAGLDGVFGLVVGLILIPVVKKVIVPVWNAVRGQRA